jgi:hypothetical protein
VFFPVSCLPTGTKPLAQRTLRVDHPPRTRWDPGFFYAAWEVPAFTFGPEQKGKKRPFKHSKSEAGRISRARRKRQRLHCSLLIETPRIDRKYFASDFARGVFDRA